MLLILGAICWIAGFNIVKFLLHIKEEILLVLATSSSETAIPTLMEKLEKLEQLRALEAGARIQVAIVEHHSVGIDTPDDYARFVERHRSHPAH